MRKFTYLVILVILFNATFATDFLINEVLIKNNKEVIQLPKRISTQKSPRNKILDSGGKRNSKANKISSRKDICLWKLCRKQSKKKF